MVIYGSYGVQMSYSGWWIRVYGLGLEDYGGWLIGLMGSMKTHVLGQLEDNWLQGVHGEYGGIG